MLDWNDLKYLLAVARAGSTLGAANASGVNQTTVARRIEALEKALGLSLFERRPDGYRATAEASQLLTLVEEVERGVVRVADRAAALTRRAAGVVRVTTTELLAVEVLAPLIAELRETQPELAIELLADDWRLDLLRGEAEVAIRIGKEPVDPGLVRQHLGQSVWSLFCAKSYAERYGRPHSVDEINGHAIIAGSGGLAGLEVLNSLRHMAPQARIATRCNSVPNLIASVRAGTGIGPLPYIAAIDDPTLIRCVPAAFDHAAHIWLIYPETLRKSPAVQAFVDAAVTRFGAVRDRLSGRAPHRFET